MKILFFSDKGASRSENSDDDTGGENQALANDHADSDNEGDMMMAVAFLDKAEEGDEEEASLGCEAQQSGEDVVDEGDCRRRHHAGRGGSAENQFVSR